jgi:hypothetical protein
VHISAPSGIQTQQERQSHDEESRLNRIDNHAGCDLGTGICARDRIECPASTSDQQAVRAYNAFAPAMAAPAVEPNTHRYEGGPKSND